MKDEVSPTPKGTVRFLLPGLLFLLFFVLSLSKIANFDYWTHLHLGRVYLSDWSLADFVAVVLTEPANAGLFQVLLYQLYTLGGHLLVSLAASGLFAGALSLFWFPVCRGSHLFLLFHLLLLLLAAKVCLNRFMVRPELLGYLIFAVSLLVAAKWLERPCPSRLVLLVVLLTAWYPLHQTVYLGAPFLGLSLLVLAPEGWLLNLWQDRSRRAITLSATVAAGIIAGYLALRFALFVFKELGPGGVLGGITEMRPTWEFPEVLTESLLMAGVTAGLCWGEPRRRWRLLLLLLPVTIVGLVVVRNVALASLAMLFLGQQGLNRWPLPALPANWRRLATVLLLVANLAVAGWLIEGRRHLWGGGLADGFAPVEAAHFVSGSQLPGPVFNNLDCGGYLLWAWQDQPAHFLDGMLGTAEKLKAHDLLLEAQLVEPLFDKYRIHTVLIQPFYWNSGRLFPLVTRLMFDPAWSLVHASDALVFVDALPPGMRALPKAEGWRAILSFADSFEKLNETAAHIDFSRGIAWQGLGEFAKAQSAFAKGIDSHPELAGYYRSIGLFGHQ